LNFLRNMQYVDIGPEVPIMKDTEVRRWEVTLRVQVSLQMGWIDKLLWDPTDIMETAEFFDTEDFFESTKGIVSIGSDILYDPSADFGLTTTNDPQILSRELSKGWYYIQLRGEPQNYPVVEIVDSNRLRLLTRKVDDTGDEPYSSPDSETDVSYKLVWNAVHIHCRIPNNNS